jgi:hypothetical protein
MPQECPGERLKREIDIPDGWRETYVNREFLDVAAFPLGIQILCTHEIPDNYVCEITRIEAGVFAVLNPTALQPTISQIDQLHWWALFADSHPPVALLPPLPLIDWRLFFVTSTGPFDDQNTPPPNGTHFQIPPGLVPGPWVPFGDIERMWPDARTGLISYSPHKVIVGPRIVGILAGWQQPPPKPNPSALPYAFAQSWGILEGRNLRYDSPEARRLLLGGLT